MNTPRAGLLLLGALAIAASAAPQDWKAGTGRLEGQVLEAADGKPIPGAVVRLELPGRGGTQLKADKKGHWAILGLTGGRWNVDIEAQGYVAKKLSATVLEFERIPTVVVRLDKAKPTGPAPEVVEANKKAEEAYAAGRFAEARQEYEKLLTLLPDLAPRLHERIGFTYIQEKQFAKAVEQLKMVLQAEPANAQVRAFAAQAALEGGMVDEGKVLLADLEETVIKDPDLFFNIGVNFLNAGLNDEAISFFTKAVTVNPDYVDGYYRRALAYLAQGKTAESRADFEKVVQLAPEGAQAEMARKALAQLE